MLFQRNHGPGPKAHLVMPNMSTAAHPQFPTSREREERMRLALVLVALRYLVPPSAALIALHEELRMAVGASCEVAIYLIVQDVFFWSDYNSLNPLIDTMMLANHPSIHASPHQRHSKIANQSSCHVRCSNVDNLKQFATTERGSNRRCKYFDLHKQLVPYIDAWAWQKSVVDRRLTLVEKDEDKSDVLIVLQHPPVYTLGTGSSEKYLNFDIENAPYDVYRTERGGEVTYHGPGQLVMYPILNLRYHRMDLHWYLRSLEEVIIRVLSSTFSIESSRVEGLTGVWIGKQKVAAIGIRTSRWMTYHGLALNVTTDLSPFQGIVPCGIRNRGVCSLKQLLQQTSSSNWETDDLSLMDITHESLIKEFSQVFQLSLDHHRVSDYKHFAELVHSDPSFCSDG